MTEQEGCQKFEDIQKIQGQTFSPCVVYNRSVVVPETKRGGLGELTRRALRCCEHVKLGEAGSLLIRYIQGFGGNTRKM